MRYSHPRGLAILTLAAVLSCGCPAGAVAETTLRFFIGGQQRPDVIRQITEAYSKSNPAVKIEIEVGGTTPEQQQRFLSGALAAKDGTLDLILIDVLRPAQWAVAQVIEPLDAYLGTEKEAILARYLPAFRATASAGGKLVSLPYFADAQFLYYRKDLLEKYGFQPPKTWDDLKAVSLKIMESEKAPNLRGFETAGAPVEGAVCSYLVPLWGGGEDLLKDGKLNLAGTVGKKPFDLWADLKAAKVTPPNLAEIATDRIRQDLQSGNLIFGMTWGYVWSRTQDDADSTVKDKIGIAPLPGFTADKPVSCIGGWQVAVSGFSQNKAEAVKFARYLSSPEVSRMQAILGSHLPVFASVYADEEVLRTSPWFAQALPAMLAAKARPISPRYADVSEIIRTNMNAFFAGTKTADAALADMNARLGAIFREGSRSSSFIAPAN
jgi:multiple sugar transport system substrate-binding protein